MSRTAIEGFFLSFGSDEFVDIKNKLRVLGYSQDGEGLKSYVLRCMKRDVDKEEPVIGNNIVKRVLDFAMENPETVNYYRDVGHAVLAGLAQKIKKR